MKKLAFVIVMAVCMVSVAQDKLREKLNAPSRMQLGLPGSVSTTQAAAVTAKDSSVPKSEVKPDKRAARRAEAARESQPPMELPPLISTAADALPRRVSFEEPNRYRAAGVPQTALRLPNLVGPPRRAMWQSTNPSVNPSPAVRTATVNNLNGTSELALMPPFMRKIIIELAPAPAPLAVGQEPYLQAAGAPDDADAPVSATSPPAAVRLE